MERNRVVCVETVFSQQLPVGPRTVRLLARDDFHPDFRLVRDQIEILSRAGKIVVETVSRGIETGEDEAAIAVDLCGRGQSQLVARERLAIRFFTRHADKPSTQIKRPRVIGALKRLRVARFLPAYLSATMRTRVEQHANDLVVPAHQYHRPPANGPRSIAAGLRNFDPVPDVTPAPPEKP